ncbi:MAG: winged helix-turn-helix transcriptional regulator [Methanosarcinales archaeon]|nr:winged helix-turn-helix transcriptional regulator [Methanosarcinales archaeon]
MTKYITFLSLFIFLIFSTTALSDDGGYVVRPHVEDGMGVDSTGADAIITFWDLPLWIQVYYVSGLLMALLVSLKIFPAVISCIKRFVKNQNRQNISKYIVDNPGTTKAEISNNLGINRGTVKYHVHKLESDSKIASMKVSKFTKLFKNSSELKNDEKIITSHIRGETSRILLWNILENPGITNQELAKTLRLDKSTVHWHAHKFLADDMIRFEKEGRYLKYYVKDDVAVVMPALYLPIGGPV